MIPHFSFRKNDSRALFVEYSKLKTQQCDCRKIKIQALMTVLKEIEKMLCKDYFFSIHYNYDNEYCMLGQGLVYQFPHFNQYRLPCIRPSFF